jgi:integrase/recombinase XerC
MSDIIEAHLEYLEREQKAKTTLNERRIFLKCAHRELPHGLDGGRVGVYDTDITAFLANPDWARSTARTYFVYFRQFYRWAVNEGWMSSDITAGMKAPSLGRFRPKPVALAELLIALRLSPEPWFSCIMLGIGAGLRASELATIRREDITPEFVHVRHGKGDKERWVDTSYALWDFVCERPSGLLVRDANGAAVTGKWLSGRQQRHWRSIGLPHWHLHRLRHTFCTTAWRSNADPLAVRDLMGHVSIATTQLYVEPEPSERRRALSAIDALLREHQPVGTRLVPAAA